MLLAAALVPVPTSFARDTQANHQAPFRSADHMPGLTPDSIEFSLDLPASAPRGAPVTITLRLTNVSGRQMDLYLRGREIVFDLTITQEDGTLVWRRLDGNVIPAILRIEQLAPGAVMELRHLWDQRSRTGVLVPPGAYRARGELLTEGESLVTPERSFVISPA